MVRKLAASGGLGVGGLADPESQLQILGEVKGRDILELGAVPPMVDRFGRGRCPARGA